jgi:hypothetical protein
MVPGMVPRRRLAALATALFLAAAAPAGAQSAGDDQYEDPFGGGGTPGASGGGDDSGSSGGGTDTGSSAEGTGTGSSTPAPSTGDDASVPSADAPDSGGASQPAPAAPSGEQLPVTGAAAGLVALAGTILVAGGIALRVRLRDQR